jgi:formylglycine-generating enzyme required for sulfatase activity
MLETAPDKVGGGDQDVARSVTTEDHALLPGLEGGGGAAGDGSDGGWVLADYVRIEPGMFVMGSPVTEEERASDETQREVRITRAFWMKTTEVTQGEWSTVMGSNPSSFPSCGSMCPVENVSWHDAVRYANKLSEREGLERCYGDEGGFVGLRCTGYRLPTEAEWEYAARAGTTGARHGPMDDVAWHWDNSARRPKPVGKKTPNAWGLYDMLGNLWEWVQDWHGDYGGNATDPTGPDTGVDRVFRGGCWSLGLVSLRAAARGRNWPSFRNDYIGFRVVRSIP